MRKTPIFSLAFTSVRPAAIPAVVRLWNERSALKTHEWAIAVDAEDAASEAAAAAAVRDACLAHPEITGRVAVNPGARTCVAGWNCAAAATTGKVIIAVADDFMPPEAWDMALLALEPKGWEDGEHVIKTEDGYVHDIFVLPILTRKRYERFGYLYYPRYSSMFCDTEFGDVARRDGAVIEANHLLFEHMHPDCGKRQRDTVDLVHASQERWNSGEMLYKFRKAQGFPLDDGPNAVKQVPAAASPNQGRYVAYMQVAKDDLCLLDVCRRLLTEGVKDFCLCQPDAYWSGEAVEPEAAAQIAAVVAALRADGATVYHRMFPVEQFRVAGDSRIQVETRVRNASLDWITELGYQHILIIDGDELWMPGTLRNIDAYAQQGHQVISCYMTPIIGVPGYPVDFSKDLAVVYVKAGVKFKSCRTPFTRQSIIPKPLIYHFTGTRRNLDETIKKHRRSGHYDDPDYLFEEWLEKCLPNIKPGFTHKWPSGHEGAHFYGPYQIWPKIRDWRAGELEAMPESLRPYLPAPNDPNRVLHSA